jgi:hypothetical protein
MDISGTLHPGAYKTEFFGKDICPFAAVPFNPAGGNNAFGVMFEIHEN